MDRRTFLASAGAVACAGLAARRSEASVPAGYRVTYFDVRPPGGGRAGARDITAAGDGTFWFCGQRNGTLNRLNPRDGSVRTVMLGQGSAPHGVIRGPDGAAWVTDGGQNAIARVDPGDLSVKLWRLPERFPNTNLNTGVFDPAGTYWFTGQNGIYGRFVPARERMDVWEAPRGRGPYGITRTPQGGIWYVSLAGNHLAQIEDLDSGRVRTLDPPTPGQGARRVWSDSAGRLWISEWNSGNVSVHDSRDNSWRQWKLPGDRPRTYSVWVDPSDKVWLTDFAANAIVRFDPANRSFLAFPSDRDGANVRQMDGVDGEAWGGESGLDRMVRVQYGV
jgi:virginiamycin B lyase